VDLALNPGGPARLGSNPGPAELLLSSLGLQINVCKCHFTRELMEP
jgi:hypothetical protein